MTLLARTLFAALMVTASVMAFSIAYSFFSPVRADEASPTTKSTCRTIAETAQKIVGRGIRSSTP